VSCATDAAPRSAHTVEVVTDAQASVRTFVIADIRGYSRYTDEFGDEAAARLAAKFSCLVGEGIEAHGGDMVEIRGDEALAVFTSARQAIRAAVDLQKRFDEETELDEELPMRVGIGIDSGEAAPLADGTFRGSALNVAARLCGRAHGGEVIVSEATYRLAGRMAGLTFTDRGRVRLKNIPDPVHILSAQSDEHVAPQGRWVFQSFGRERRTLGWKLAIGIVSIAAVTAAAVVYLTTNDHGQPGSAAPGPGGISSPGAAPLPADAGLDVLVPPRLWQDCQLQTVAEPNAMQTAVCLPPNGLPDRWQISMYANGAALRRAYTSAVGRESIERNSGRCTAFSWGGERQWMHGPGKPGGRIFCYFDGDDAVAVWTHQRLGQPTHRDVLIEARESGSDHADLTRWWRPWHHQIGKAD